MIKNVLFIAFYIIILLLLDIVYIYSINTSTPNYITIIAIDIGIGLFFAFLLMVNYNVIRVLLFVLISFLVFFYTVLVFDEIVIYKVAGHVFTFSTIMCNLINIFTEYGGDIFSNVMAKIVPLSITLFIVILFLYISKRIYIGKKDKSTHRY